MKKRLTWGAALAAGALVIPVTAAQADEGDLVEFTVDVNQCVETEFAEVEVNDVDADSYRVDNDTLSGEGTAEDGFNHLNIEVNPDTSCLLSENVVVTENGVEADLYDVALSNGDRNLHVTWLETGHGLDPQDGSDDDGDDEDGSNEDGSNEDGSNESGQDDDGADENGDNPSEDDSGDENGADDAGADENGSDEDGDSDDTVSADGSGITVGSGDGNAEAATPVTAQPRNVG